MTITSWLGRWQSRTITQIQQGPMWRLVLRGVVTVVCGLWFIAGSLQAGWTLVAIAWTMATLAAVGLLVLMRLRLLPRRHNVGL